MRKRPIKTASSIEKGGLNNAQGPFSMLALGNQHKPLVYHSAGFGLINEKEVTFWESNHIDGVP